MVMLKGMAQCGKPFVIQDNLARQFDYDKQCCLRRELPDGTASAKYSPTPFARLVKSLSFQKQTVSPVIAVSLGLRLRRFHARFHLADLGPAAIKSA